MTACSSPMLRCLRPLLMCCALAALGVTLPVAAEPPQDPLRALQPGRGQLDVTLGFAMRSSSALFGAEGRPVAMDPPATFSVRQLSLEVRYGLTDRIRAYAWLPLLSPLLENDAAQGDIRNPTPLLGDALLGLQLQRNPRRKNGVELRLEGFLRAPTGLSTPGAEGTGLLTGTGIPQLGLALQARGRLGPLRPSFGLGYALSPSQVVPYLETVYADGTTGQARLKPGDEASARLGFLLPVAGRLILEADARVSWQGTYKQGPTTSAFMPSLELTPIPESSGLFADAGGSLALPLGSRFLLEASARYRFLGRSLPELAALGLEAFSPLPGLSAGAGLRVRL